MSQPFRGSAVFPSRRGWALGPSILVVALLTCDGPLDAPPPPGGAPLPPDGWAAALAGLTAELPWNLDDEWAEVARSEVPGFAGYFIDEAGDHVVAVTSPARVDEAAAWLASRLEREGTTTRGVRTRVVQYSFDRLRDWKVGLLHLLDGETIYWLDIDEVQNRLLFGVATSSLYDRVRAAADAIGVPPDAVVVAETSPPVPRQSLGHTMRPVEGGLRIEAKTGPNWNDKKPCTLGFNAYRSGILGFVTASHCSKWPAQLDSTVQHQANAETAAERIGFEVVDPSGSRKADAAFYEYDLSADSVNWAHIARTEYSAVGGAGSRDIDASHPGFRITGKAPNAVQAVGQTVNKMGMISGWTQGQVTHTCVARAASGVTYPCSWVAALWSRVGDSGSPIFQQVGTSEPQASEVTLWGVLFGGPVEVWDTTWYSPISLVEADLGPLYVACDPHPLPCDPPLVVHLMGPTSIETTGPYSWNAAVWGGNGSYSYVWEYRIKHDTFWCSFETGWTQVGTGASYGDVVYVPGYDFQLRVTVTSGAQSRMDDETVQLASHLECPL